MDQEISRLYSPKIAGWDEQEKERQIQAGKDMVETLKKAASAGQKEFRIQPGNYRFPEKKGILFENLHDMTICGEGTCFWFDSYDTKAISFKNCRNVSFSGVVNDMDPLPFIQGIISEIKADQQRNAKLWGPGGPWDMNKNSTD